MMARMKAFADKHVERLISRKFLAWTTATGALFGGALDGDNWVAVTLVYIGSQAMVDLATRWKFGPDARS